MGACPGCVRLIQGDAWGHVRAVCASYRDMDGAPFWICIVNADD